MLDISVARRSGLRNLDSMNLKFVLNHDFIYGPVYYGSGAFSAKGYKCAPILFAMPICQPVVSRQQLHRFLLNLMRGHYNVPAHFHFSLKVVNSNGRFIRRTTCVPERIMYENR
jgi:hypothetical protein